MQQPRALRSDVQSDRECVSPWIPVPNDERQQKQESRAKHSYLENGTNGNCGHSQFSGYKDLELIRPGAGIFFYFSSCLLYSVSVRI